MSEPLVTGVQLRMQAIDKMTREQTEMFVKRRARQLGQSESVMYAIERLAQKNPNPPFTLTPTENES